MAQSNIGIYLSIISWFTIIYILDYIIMKMNIIYNIRNKIILRDNIKYKYNRKCKIYLIYMK